ncbi:DNA polymerase beta domain protein region [Calothrix sp. NIES-4071]|nr:DNA polymerase beta domain protein region [Calothrix sp. NIES-4071]BAZ63454.1 DNA polymerase beta domain protein region [Calothrix sp. NIES-4105]
MVFKNKIGSLYLETLLGRSVVGTPNSLKSYLRETVMGEAVRAL